MKFTVTAWVVLCAVTLSAQPQANQASQDDIPARIASTITGEDLRSYLMVLASDEFEGRETGTPGNTRAAEFIAGKFEEFGIDPIPGDGDYFQEVAFSRVRLESASLALDGASFDHMKDFVVMPQLMPGTSASISTGEVVFMGYGIEDPNYSDYLNSPDLTGRTIMIYAGEPRKDEAEYVISGSLEPSAWSYDYMAKLRLAKSRGADNVLIIANNFRDLVQSQRRAILGGSVVMGEVTDNPDLPATWIISSTFAEQILGKRLKKVIRMRDRANRKGKFKPVTFEAQLSGEQRRQVELTPGANVLAYIEGSDPALKQELVVITAHYDHIGKRGKDIYNGADDNGSGTSGVMEIAQAYQYARENGLGPRRSVLCMLVTGEEIGLLGSEYYTEFPVFPLENTVANINIDMIGRKDDSHSDSAYVYVIGSDRLSSELHSINENANATYINFELDYTYNAKDDPNQFYYRSDHYNFAKNGIPSVFFFSGVHEDYHRPTDTADKIMFDKAAAIARLAFHTSWEIANRDKRLVVDVPQ